MRYEINYKYPHDDTDTFHSYLVIGKNLQYEALMLMAKAIELSEHVNISGIDAYSDDGIQKESYDYPPIYPL